MDKSEFIKAYLNASEEVQAKIAILLENPEIMTEEKQKIIDELKKDKH